MTRKMFIKILDKRGYSYHIQGEKIVVTKGEDFPNYSNILLDKLKSIPPDVVFTNTGNVVLRTIKTVPSGVEFRNGGHLWLDSLESISIGAIFYNEGRVKMDKIFNSSNGWFEYEEWPGNIEGIDSKRLFNFMISKGMFI